MTKYKAIIHADGDVFVLDGDRWYAFGSGWEQNPNEVYDPEFGPREFEFEVVIPEYDSLEAPVREGDVKRGRHGHVYIYENSQWVDYARIGATALAITGPKIANGIGGGE